MSLSNIDADRVLTREEVRTMLLEDAISEDKEVAQIMKRWKSGLRKCHRSKAFCDADPGRIRVSAWKVEQTYIFETADKNLFYKQSLVSEPYSRHCAEEMAAYLTRIPTSAQIEGLSISEIEGVAEKFFSPDSPIKCLLDAGFILELTVPRSFLGL